MPRRTYRKPKSRLLRGSAARHHELVTVWERGEHYLREVFDFPTRRLYTNYRGQKSNQR